MAEQEKKERQTRSLGPVGPAAWREGDRSLACSLVASASAAAAAAASPAPHGGPRPSGRARRGPAKEAAAARAARNKGVGGRRRRQRGLPRAENQAAAAASPRLLLLTGGGGGGSSTRAASPWASRARSPRLHPYAGRAFSLWPVSNTRTRTAGPKTRHGPEEGQERPLGGGGATHTHTHKWFEIALVLSPTAMEAEGLGRERTAIGGTRLVISHL